MRPCFILLVLFLPAALGAQVVDSTTQRYFVDSIAQRYCPKGSTDITATGDTVVVRPELYHLDVTQSTNLRAFQCGHMKAREVTRLSGVRWWSSDTTIVKVARTTGRVTAVRNGEATVFACYPSPCVASAPGVGALPDVTKAVARLFTVRRT